jgi:hypothetical protein
VPTAVITPTGKATDGEPFGGAAEAGEPKPSPVLVIRSSTANVPVVTPPIVRRLYPVGLLRSSPEASGTTVLPPVVERAVAIKLQF